MSIFIQKRTFMLHLSQRKFVYLFSFILVVYLVLRILNGNYFLNDSYEYLKTVELLKSGEYFSSTEDISKSILLTQRGLTYPIFLLIFDQLSFNTILIIQTFFGFFNLLLISSIFKKLGGSNYFYLSLLLFFSPAVFIYTHLIMTEFLAFFLILCIFNFALNFNKKRHLFYIQIFLTLLVFLKPVFYFFPFINAFFLIYLSIKQKKQYYLLSLIPIAAVILYMGFNENRTGYNHFSSMQNINLINYNIYLHKAKTNGVKIADLWKKNLYNKVDMFDSFSERSKYLSTVGKNYITENFVSYSIFHLYGSLRGTLDPGRFDLMTFSNEPYDSKQGLLNILNTEKSFSAIKGLLQTKHIWVLLLLIPIFLVNIVKLLYSLIYLLKTRTKLSFSIVFISTLIIYYIVLTGPVNASRYMMPIQGVLIILSSLYLNNYFEHNKKLNP